MFKCWCSHDMYLKSSNFDLDLIVNQPNISSRIWVKKMESDKNLEKA